MVSTTEKQFLLPRVKAKRFKCYSCDSPCKNDTQHAHHCNNALQCWKSRTRNAFGEEQIARGCTTSMEQIPFCSNKLNDDREKRQISGHYNIYCCYGDYCNGGDFPILPIHSGTDESSKNVTTITLLVIFPVILLVAVAAALYFGLFKRKKASKPTCSSIEGQQTILPLGDDSLKAIRAGDSTLREYFEHSVSSGSGGGLPLLVQKTLASQVTLADCIGRGRYGEVWRGVWHGENVAVKIFYSRDEESWKRETEIYSTVLLRHENILGYIGSDMTSRNSTTQLWLLTQYYPLGSLFDHLTRTPITRKEMLKICLSICNGMVHLHTEIFGTEGKPAMAHRDIKTKNILVKLDGSCVIADFGLTVTYTQVTGHTDFGSNNKVGTRRYMAPEVLDETINTSNFEDLRKTDIYALGLIFWEICKRMTFNGISEEFKIAYSDVVPPDPSEQDMKKVVVTDNIRPTIPNIWTCDHLMDGMSKIMKESWHANPNVRLPILRIKKSIQKLADFTEKLNVIDEEDKKY